MIKDNLNVLRKAFKISILVKSKFSIIINTLGFIFAFFPAIIALRLATLTNNVQRLMEGEISLKITIQSFLMLTVLQITQLIFQFLQDLNQNIESRITMYKYIRSKIIKHKCEVKYKYIENYDDFNKKIAFAETRAAKQVALSFQNIIMLLQQIITFISVTYILFNIKPIIVFILLFTSLPAVLLAYKQKDETYFAERIDTKACKSKFDSRLFAKFYLWINTVYCMY